MDIISFNEASTANGRIENFIENPDSTSGIITVPKVIESTETVTIPAGRVAVLPNLVIDGVLNIENGGEVFIPSGSTFGDLDAQLALKADTSYVNTQLAGKANTIVANDSQVKTALNASGTAPIYACRAWVNFNGTGTVAIRASGNVSSITDNGVGDYTVNFTTAMTDANYCLTGSVSFNSVDNSTYSLRPDTTSGILTTSARVISTAIGGSTSSRNDCPFASVTIFR